MNCIGARNSFSKGNDRNEKGKREITETENGMRWGEGKEAFHYLM